MALILSGDEFLAVLDVEAFLRLGYLAAGEVVDRTLGSVALHGVDAGIMIVGIFLARPGDPLLVLGLPSPLACEIG